MSKPRTVVSKIRFYLSEPRGTRNRRKYRYLKVGVSLPVVASIVYRHID